MTDNDLCEVTISAPDPDWLTDLCRQLVGMRLASSAHIIHPVTTVYRWQGDVRQAIEARAFLRSRAELLDDLAAYVIKRHPYRVPNITAVPLIGGNPDYLAWVREETTRPRSSGTSNDS